VLLVTPRWKLTPSANKFLKRQPVKLSRSIGPSIQAPTLVCSIHTLDTVEFDSAPPMPLTWSLSTREVVSPKIAKSLSVTLVLAPGPPSAEVNLPYTPTPRPWSTEYHGPAPASVTLSTTMWRLML
jgi:hypothetical protein